MSIARKMREYVHQHGSTTTEAIAASLSELRDCGGVARALLLLRLNPLFERVGEQWTLRGKGQRDEDIVREAAVHYFVSIACPGAPLKKVVAEVAKTTRIEAAKVKQMLTEQFAVVNTNIFNRPKQ